MKKITIVCILLLSILFQSNAQNLPNNGFENWTNPSNPNSWAASYSGTVGGLLPLSLSFGVKTTDAHSGSYALKISPLLLPIGNITMPGIIQLGSVGSFNIDADLLTALSSMDFSNLDPTSLASLQALMSKGLSMSESPSEVKFWYKFFPDGDDIATVNVITSKWNASLGISEIVASGTTTISGSANQYTEMNVAMSKTGASPVCDTIKVIITVGGTTASVATEFLIDDITLKFETWGTCSQPIENFKLYPNPASQFFIVQGSDANLDNLVEIFDTFGKSVYKQSNITTQTFISTSDLNAGMYLVRFTQGDKTSTSKLIVK